jgi:hypothetical protein
LPTTFRVPILSRWPGSKKAGKLGGYKAGKLEIAG